MTHALYLFLSLFLLCAPSLRADENELDPSLAVIEGEPSAHVAGCVNAVTGDFFMAQDEIVVQGAVPLKLRRTYISGNGGKTESPLDGKVNQGGWNFLPHLYIFRNDEESSINIPQPSGAVLSYVYYRRTKFDLEHDKEVKLTPLEHHGLTNAARGHASAVYALKNQTVIMRKKEIVVQSPEGIERIYTKKDGGRDSFFAEHVKHDKPWALFVLDRERLPSGHLVVYTYDDHQRLTSVSTRNPSETIVYAWAQFTYEGYKDNYTFTVSTSDLRQYRYEWDKTKKKWFHLVKVTHAHHPDETLHYHDATKRRGPLLAERALPDGRKIQIEYYHVDKSDPVCNRVKAIYAPVGQAGEMIATHRFFHAPGKIGTSGGYTEVLDATGNQTTYRYSPQLRLETIEYDNNKRPFRKDQFIWDKEGNLIATFIQGEGEILQAKRLRYDDRANLIEEVFYEQPISLDQDGMPHSENQERKEYTYNPQNLLIREKNGDLITVYTYLPKTNLITSKLTLDKDTIRIRHFYLYDGNHLLIKEIEDDGSSASLEDLSNVTERRITEITRHKRPEPVNRKDFIRHIPKAERAKYKQKSNPTPYDPYDGMPEWIAEKYQDTSQEKLLKETHLAYSIHGQLTSQDVYDADHNLLYSIKKTYDHKGRLTSETNPLGQQAYYTYDASNNKLTATSFSGRQTSHFTYDHANRCTTITATGDQQETHTTTILYDSLSNPIATTNYLGHTTHIEYDAAGNPMRTHLPTQVCIHRQFDALGREITLTTPLGTTHTTYNSHGKATTLTHPDNTSEHFIYNTHGALTQAIDQEGRVTAHTHDFLDRETSKTTYSSQGKALATESYTYSAFHLTATRGSEGLLTTFDYDRAGRKIAQHTGDSSTCFSYDSLGRVITTKTGERITHTTYNLAGSPTEEIITDTQDRFLSRTLTTYDSAGNTSSTTQFIHDQEAVHHWTYDAFGRLTQSTDPLGHTTVTTYQQDKQLITDPSGLQTTHTYDALGHCIHTTQEQHGRILTSNMFTYDPCGNLICQKNTDGTTLLWEYDTCQRLIALHEGQKTTRYTYTPTGKLHILTKPNGVQLTHTYDALGHLRYLFSSDGTIHYAYEHDTCGRLIRSCDTRSRVALTRTYSPRGNLLTEERSNEPPLIHTYDILDRRTHLILPDGSSIAYHYDPLFLRAVERISPEGKTLYTHHYNTYDLSGNILTETLHNRGTVSYSRDPLGRVTHLATPYGSVSQHYDALGNITHIHSSLGKPSTHTTYTYDALSQLTQETGPFPHTFTYDTQHNRLTQDNHTLSLNTLNQVTASEADTFTYDPNGNLTTHTSQAGTTTYTYDALDRLTEVTTPHTKTFYTYDSLHRRCTKTSYIIHQSHLEELEHLNFLYDNDHEIGATDKNGHIIQLRILGNTPHAEISSAIALELNHKTFVPLHDLQGNLTTLIDTTHTLTTYTYSAFQPEASSLNTPGTPNNPWRFASKRLDPETNLIYFGRRYYIPTLGRWLTPDPAGHLDSPNLYQYTLNNPLRYRDPDGLYTLDNFSQDTLNILSSPRFQGSIQAFAGFTEASLGTMMTAFPPTAPLGIMLIAHGADHFAAGSHAAIFGRHTLTATNQLLQKTGMSFETAASWDHSANFAATFLGVGLFQKGVQCITKTPSLLQLTPTSQLGLMNKLQASNHMLNAVQEEKFFASTLKAYNQNLTHLAHSFSKHAGRHPETWGKLKGPMTEWQDQAVKQLKNIYHAPGEFKTIVDPKTGLTWIEKRLPDGRGIRLNQDYTFKGFVD